MKKSKSTRATARRTFSRTVLLLAAVCLCSLELDAQQTFNINGKDVVPRITFPGITQDDFQDAFNVLNECLVTNLPVAGFTRAFMYPGGEYYKNWWQLDGSLALSGSKWASQKFAEGVVRNFIEVQRPDGRIPLYGPDTIALPFGTSSLPTLFEIGFEVVRRSDDTALVRATYTCLKKYLHWWLSDTVRRDSPSGLITGVFEETVPPDFSNTRFVRAPVDLNVELVLGCANIAALARRLGVRSEYEKYSALQKELTNLINKYMWDEKKGAYLSYFIKKQERDDRLTWYTFYPFRLNIAPGDRAEQMVKMLVDDRYFGWSGNTLTSAAKTDTTYNETKGVYNGKQWSGAIWTLCNDAIVKGLEDIGRYDLSAHLALKTARLFNANYAEFIMPSDGSGQGQLRYCWSASQYVEILVEKIFGVDYDAFGKTLTIMPRLDADLLGHDIALDSLLLPNGSRLTLHISNQPKGVTIAYALAGKKNTMDILLAMPVNGNQSYTAVDAKQRSAKFMRIKKGAAWIYQVNTGKKSGGEIMFVRNNIQ
jgi:hypothetical protein